MIDIQKVRQDTPGCVDKTFLNSAGSSLMPKGLVKKMSGYLQEEELFGGYEIANKYADQLNEFYTEVAKLIHCKPQNVAFANSATDAYGKALASIPFKSGDCIITTDDDYISNQIAFISLKKQLGIQIYRIKKLADNGLDLDDLEQLIKKYSPKLIAVTHVPTNSGLIQDVAPVGQLCDKHDILYLVDACQSVGQLEVDVNKIGCDFLTATGRKFLRGPRGTGFLYVSDKVLQKKLSPLLMDMKGAIWTDFDDYRPNNTAKGFEFWEQPCAAIIGFTEAIRYANQIGMNNIQQYNQQLSNSLRNLLAKNERLNVLDQGTALSSIVTFNHQDMKLEKLKQELANQQVYFSVSYKAGALIDFTAKNVDWAIRFSPHYFNTLAEIEKVASLLR